MRADLDKANGLANALYRLLCGLAGAVVLLMAVHIFLSVCSRLFIQAPRLRRAQSVWWQPWLSQRRVGSSAKPCS